LANYGFDVSWNDHARTLSVERSKDKVFSPLNVPPADRSRPPGAFKMHYLYTDIRTFLSGAEVSSYAIDGQTLIDFDDLGIYGTFGWNDAARAITLTLD
jgi:hypothetical protein